MGRPEGSRNEGYEQQREKLARAVLERLKEPDGAQASFREFARSADVTPPTLRHYFDNRDGAIRAALELALEDGKRYLEMTAEAEFGAVEEALPSLLRFVIVEWRDFGVGAVHRAGFCSGLTGGPIGPAYVELILEPFLQSIEERLNLHIRRGELRQMNVRSGALSLIAPIMLALMHQDDLGGDECRTIDIDGLIQQHVDAFLRAWLVEQPEE
jgi:AcrR family transcriptional regulator